LTNEEVVKLYWDTCWNDRRVERLGEVFHDPYLHNRTEHTPGLMAGIVHGAIQRFSDFRVRVDQTEFLARSSSLVRPSSARRAARCSG